MNVYHECVDVHEGQERGSDPLELELQVDVRCCESILAPLQGATNTFNH